MNHLMESLAELIQRHIVWAGPILGLVTFGESMVLIGAFFPATALMIVAGTLAGAGMIHPVPVLLWCVAGAIAGDAVSFWIGRSVGPRAWRYPALRPHLRMVARARLFFRKYGIASIVLCRFIGPVRAMVPLIAGVTRMRQARFQAANVVGALVWVPVMLAPGYLTARGLDRLGSEGIERLSIGIAALAITGLVLLAVHSRVRQGATAFNPAN